jgi:hypothetical protein
MRSRKTKKRTIMKRNRILLGSVKGTVTFVTAVPLYNLNLVLVSSLHFTTHAVILQ